MAKKNENPETATKPPVSDLPTSESLLQITEMLEAVSPQVIEQLQQLCSGVVSPTRGISIVIEDQEKLWHDLRKP